MIIRMRKCQNDERFPCRELAGLEVCHLLHASSFGRNNRRNVTCTPKVGPGVKLVSGLISNKGGRFYGTKAFYPRTDYLQTPRS